MSGAPPSRPILRPILYDATQFVHRLRDREPTGIDRIDGVLARALLESGAVAGAVHIGLFRPHIFSRERFARLLERSEARASSSPRAEDDPQWRALRGWLLDEAAAPGEPAAAGTRNGFWGQTALRLADDAPWFGPRAPRGAVYLHVSQAALEHPRFFRWLDARPDISPVFFLHDLLPLDRPEFFPDGYRALFERRLATALRYARALITTSRTTAARIEAEIFARGLKAIPVLAAPPPSPLGGPATADDFDAALAGAPYAAMLATLEPRKNHALLFDLWPQITQATGLKLALVGARGWGCEGARAQLEGPLAPWARRVSGLGPAALRRLIVNARMVLAPSFAEGYGLPVAEALALGAPLAASDIPVFREIADGRARFIAPTDRDGWRAAVLHLAAAPARPAPFVPPDPAQYARAILDFLARLPAGRPG